MPKQALGGLLSLGRRTRRQTTIREVVSREQSTWQQAVREACSGDGVLIATSTGGHPAVTPVEASLAIALTLRGARVHVLLCDGALPACMECDITRYQDVERFAAVGPQADRCRGCFDSGRRVFEGSGIQVHRYSDLLTSEEQEWARRLAGRIAVDDIAGFTLDGLAVGEHANAGALRFFARGDLRGELHADKVRRRYFEAALLTVAATRRVVDTTRVTTSVFHHGIYVPQGLVGEVLRSRGVHVVNWVVAYRRGCFIFSHDETYHHTLMNEPPAIWEDIKWGDACEAVISEYLRSRWYGTDDWIWFHEDPETGVDRIESELGIDFRKPTIGLLTNVVWDAQLHYPANAFRDMLEWLHTTIEYFRIRTDLQLIVRVHPAEIRGTLATRQPAVEEIKRWFPSLPSNVFVVPPESRISTYAAMERCNAVIIYGTKTGVELSAMGVPVIVAGEAWIRNKGITMDARSVEQYIELLDSLPLLDSMDESTLTRARKYAFHFFMRRMVPIEALVPCDGWPPYSMEKRGFSAYTPGASSGLDIVCNGILSGSDFVYPCEEFLECGGHEGDLAAAEG